MPRSPAWPRRAWLPPGPASLRDAIASALILAATAALVVLMPWDRLPAWCDVAVPLPYTASLLPVGGPV
ncbi:MAG: hypothetical protein ACR2MP_08140 [Streptosporangiaceae bacterium]